MSLKLRLLSVVFGITLIWSPNTVIAQSSSSPSYQVNEYGFGSGGDIDSNSAHYNARASAGNLGVGEVTSSIYRAFAGYVTPSEEYLELNITLATVDLGTLDTSTTGTGNGNFYVRTYMASGYVVKTMSQTLTSEGGATITALSAGGGSTTGTEQFGINLVANTAPTTFGADPVPQPNSGFAFGAAASGYGTTNSYKYNVSDTVAQATIGWGETDYTVSYIANISATTEAGTYTMIHDLVAVATF